jgi:hypothetical protein
MTDAAKKIRDEEELRIAEEKDDARWILADPRGRRFVSRILNETRVFAPCFTGNATTYLYLGKRDVGLFILNQVMDANPSFFAEAYEEAKKKEEKRDG